MPNLNYPEITMGDAVYALVNLCRQYPPFMKELEGIRKPYASSILKVCTEGAKFIACNKLTLPDYYQITNSYLDGKSNSFPFSEDGLHYLDELRPYFIALNEFSDKWKLRAPWALVVLFLFDMMDLASEQESPQNVDIPIEKLALIYPWPQILPPLKITVPSWAFFVYDKDMILRDISGKIKNYELKLKQAGLKEYPWSLDKHARWWFMHHILGMRFPHIAKKLGDVDAETVKRKVWEFSKSVGITTKK